MTSTNIKNPVPRCSAGAGLRIAKPSVVAGFNPEISTDRVTPDKPLGAFEGDALLTQEDIGRTFFSCGTLSRQEIAILRGAGVSLRALCRPWGLGASEVILDGSGTFSFRSDYGAEEPSSHAILFPGFNETGDLIDIVGWVYATGWLGSWLGRAWALGAENIFWPRLDEHGALPVWRSPIDWLRSNQHGIVLIRPEAAIYYLEDAGPVLAEDLEHGIELRRQLTLPPITILVREGRGA